MESWWPLLIIGMMIFCFFGMRRCAGGCGCLGRTGRAGDGAADTPDRSTSNA